jgi:hypothetical protein
MSNFPPIIPAFAASNGPDYMDGWDLCVLGGVKLPGRCEVSGPGIHLKRDANQKPGANGGRPVYHGLEEQEPKIKIVVWTQRQLDILWGLRSKIIPIAGVEPKAVSIDTPYLKLIGVTTVTIIGATPFTWHASAHVGRGLEMTLSASHWLSASKGKGKNQTTVPKRAYRNQRNGAGPSSDDEPGGYSAPVAAPNATPGACGPPANVSR